MSVRIPPPELPINTQFKNLVREITHLEYEMSLKAQRLYELKDKRKAFYAMGFKDDSIFSQAMATTHLDLPTGKIGQSANGNN